MISTQKITQKYTLPLSTDGTLRIFNLDHWINSGNTPLNLAEKGRFVAEKNGSEWIKNQTSHIARGYFLGDEAVVDIEIYFIVDFIDCRPANPIYAETQSKEEIRCILIDLLNEADKKKYRTDGIEYYLNNLDCLE